MYKIKNIIIYIISLNLALLSFLSFSYGAPEDTFPVRPENVPQDYIVTPNGYFHPSCVHEIKNDEIINPGLIVEKSNGDKRKIEECKYSNFSRFGKERVIEKNSHTENNFSDGWQLSASYTIPESFRSLGSMQAEWHVPENPSVSEGQTLYFFIGTGHSPELSILQSVLGWNQLNRKGWTLASWNCCEEGRTYHSTPVMVNANDSVTGFIGFDRSMRYGYVVQTFSASKSTQIKTRNYSTVDHVFGGVMENYSVSSCDSLPKNGSVKFSDIVASDKEHKILDLNIKPTVYHSACEYGVNINDDYFPSVELKW